MDTLAYVMLAATEAQRVVCTSTYQASNATGDSTCRRCMNALRASVGKTGARSSRIGPAARLHSMTMTKTDLRVHPINAAELDDVRRHRADRFGNVPEEFLSEGSDQLRCCLRLSRSGERLS